MVMEEVDGDLLDQPVDAIVNAWNRNIIPWWLLLPQGRSGAINDPQHTASKCGGRLSETSKSDRSVAHQPIGIATSSASCP
jgi:hypothetical protein